MTESMFTHACGSQNTVGNAEHTTCYAGAFGFYDHAYYWPHFAPIAQPMQYDGWDIACFTLSKLTGHAGLHALLIDHDTSIHNVHSFLPCRLGTCDSVRTPFANILVQHSSLTMTGPHKLLHSTYASHFHATVQDQQLSLTFTHALLGNCMHLMQDQQLVSGTAWRWPATVCSMHPSSSVSAFSPVVLLLLQPCPVFLADPFLTST